MDDFFQALRDDHSDFDKGKLESHMGDAPFEMFFAWYKDAFDKENEPNAMTISTVNKDGAPSSRIVYLKECSSEKFIFYTNYKSQKGKDIESNPNVSLLFFWPQSQRQIRIDGLATKVDSKLSDEYFASRPRASQLGAWASHQSEVLESRDVLEKRLIELNEKYPNAVPRPEHWGGYQVFANHIEFWQGRPSRLHDRFVFQLVDDKWKVFRINP